MRNRPIGSVIGSVAGLVFVLVNAGAVPGSLLWSIAAVLVFIAVIWFVVVRGPEVEHLQPSRVAMRTYGVSVVAMLVAIPVGAAIISNVFNKPDAVLVWVVFVVGAHFLPFATAFALPVFRWLALCLVVAAAGGAVLMLVFNSAAAAGGTGVAAGFVLLGFSAAGPLLAQRATAVLP